MKNEETKKSLRSLTLSVLALLATAALLTGVTMAWITNQYRLSSIGKIHPLSYISILGPGDAVIQSIDLSYDKSEVKDGVVALKRPFVIGSDTQYYDLCIAHTTNISGLQISLYEAVANGTEGDAYLAGITDKGTPYYWNKKEGAADLFERKYYVNKASGEAVVADKSHPAHSQTFRLTGDSFYAVEHVHKNAEPLYWVRTKLGKDTPKTGDYYYTNYILEITWNETDKETDILYVIAQTDSDVSG